MPPRTPEERARRKKAAEERKAARKAAKGEKTKTGAGSASQGADESKAAAWDPNKKIVQDSKFLEFPDVSLYQVLSLLTAGELGCVSMVCKQLNSSIGDARETYLMARLHQPDRVYDDMVGYTQLCETSKDAK